MSNLSNFGLQCQVVDTGIVIKGVGDGTDADEQLLQCGVIDGWVCPSGWCPVLFVTVPRAYIALPR